MIGDELDYIDENLGPQPIHIRSKAERRAIMKARGLEEFVRHVPVPGTDKAPHTSDWSKGSIDPYTLHAAEELARRAGQQTADPDIPDHIRTGSRIIGLSEGRKFSITGSLDEVRALSRLIEES